MQCSDVTIISFYTAYNKECDSFVNIRNWSTDWQKYAFDCLLNV